MTRHSARVAAASAAALASVLFVAGCDSGGKAHSSTPAPSGGGSSAATAVGKSFKAVRWWSNSAAPLGSAVDVSHPTALASSLHPSRGDYCQMLTQTQSAGKTLFTGVAATNAELQVTITAFAAEIEAVAPSQVSGAWRTLGRAIVTVARSGGDVAHLKGVDAKIVQKAAATISADATASCHISFKA